jgi:hypothetical protein
MYNATSNSWTSYPAGLGQARRNLAAASLASGLVFFAGGSTGLCLWRARLFDATFAVCCFVGCGWWAGLRSFVMLSFAACFCIIILLLCPFEVEDF